MNPETWVHRGYRLERASSRGFVKTKPQSFVESRSRDRKIEEWTKIDWGWINYNWYLVLFTLLGKSDLEKNDLLLFDLLFSEISLAVMYENLVTI